MIEIKEFAINRDDTVTDERIKDVPIYAPSDGFIGKVDHLLVNKDTLRIESIVVNDGIFKKPFAIGSEYIQTITEDAIRLKRDLLTDWIGKTVYDTAARLVGKVMSISPRTQYDKPLTVTVQEYGTDELISVTEEQITRIGKHIILNKSIDNNKEV